MAQAVPAHLHSIAEIDPHQVESRRMTKPCDNIQQKTRILQEIFRTPSSLLEADATRSAGTTVSTMAGLKQKWSKRCKKTR